MKSARTEGAVRTRAGLRGCLFGSAALALAGVFISGYLSYQRVTGGHLVCTRWAECDTVNSSPYAMFVGVPVAFIGLAGFLVLLALVLAALATEGGAQRRLLGLLLALALAGVGFSAYLTYIELFVLRALCFWCLLTAITITLLAVLGGVSLWLAAPRQLRA